MQAVRTCVLHRLNSPFASNAVSEKLELAKSLHSSTVFIPRKHQFLLDWLCSALLRDPDRLRFLEKKCAPFSFLMHMDDKHTC